MHHLSREVLPDTHFLLVITYVWQPVVVLKHAEQFLQFQASSLSGTWNCFGCHGSFFDFLRFRIEILSKKKCAINCFFAIFFYLCFSARFL
jgi:hypothetical protein